MKSVLFLVALTVYVASAATLFDNIANYDSCMTLNSNSIVLMWKINGSVINFSLSGKTTGWIGIGINKNNQPLMIGSDAIICYVTGSGVNALDSYLSAQQSCVGSSGVCPDTTYGGTNDVTVISGLEDSQNQITTVQFSRKLSTGDPYDTVITNSTQSWVYAMCSVDNIVQHDLGNAAFNLNVFATPSCGTCSGGSMCVKGCCVPSSSSTTSSASTIVGSAAISLVGLALVL